MADKKNNGKVVSQRSDQIHLSLRGKKGVKAFDAVATIDGERSVHAVATKNDAKLDQMGTRIKELHGKGAVELVAIDDRSQGRAKKILDAITQKRSRGFRSIIKAIRIKFALKRMRIKPGKLTENTPDHPKVLNELIKLARSHGIDVEIQPKQTKGRTRLIIDSIITQRSGGDPMVAKTTRIKLMLKGINPDGHTLDSPDDPQMIQRLTDIAKKMDIKIPITTRTNSERIKLTL